MYRRFLMGTNLTDEQKKLLFNKAEELFKTNFSKRFNFKEMENMSKIDLDMLKDQLFKDIIGSDAVSYVKLSLSKDY